MQLSLDASDAKGRVPPGSHTAGLTAVLLILIPIFLFSIQRDFLLASWLQSGINMHHRQPAEPVDYSWLTRGDLHIGTDLPNNGAGASLRRTAPVSANGYLIVWVGDCGSCIRANLGAWEHDAAQRGVRMLLMSTASPESVGRFMRLNPLVSPFYQDEGQSIGISLNATWPGRAYLFSSDWKLCWLERRFPGVHNPLKNDEVVRLTRTQHGLQ